MTIDPVGRRLYAGTENSGVYRLDVTITGVEDRDGKGRLPAEYVLHQNYPNPFNPTTTIQYAVPVGTRLAVSVYDLLGREVAKLVDEEKPAGVHTIQFNANELASGVYYYRLTGGGVTLTRSMVILKLYISGNRSEGSARRSFRRSKGSSRSTRTCPSSRSTRSTWRDGSRRTLRASSSPMMCSSGETLM